MKLFTKAIVFSYECICPVLLVDKEQEIYWRHFLEKRRLRIRRSRKQRDRCWPPIGHKKYIFCAQSEIRIRMSCGSGLLRVASQRLSCPFLKTSTTASFPDPNDLPWKTENDWISVPSQWFQVLVPCSPNLSHMSRSNLRSTRRSFASLQKSRQNNHSVFIYVWTEAISLSVTVFVPVQELSGVLWVINLICASGNYSWVTMDCCPIKYRFYIIPLSELLTTKGFIDVQVTNNNVLLSVSLSGCENKKKRKGQQQASHLFAKSTSKDPPNQTVYQSTQSLEFPFPSFPIA